MSYQIEMAMAAHRLYKKFDAALQERVKQEMQTIAADPKAFKQLRPPFQGIRSCRFNFRGVSSELLIPLMTSTKC